MFLHWPTPREAPVVRETVEEEYLCNPTLSYCDKLVCVNITQTTQTRAFLEIVLM